MKAKLNRIVRCAAAVTAVIAVGAGATACNSSSDESDSSAKGSQSESKGGEQETGGVKMEKMAQKGSRTDAVNPSAKSASDRCHTGDLNFNWDRDGATDMDSNEQQSVMLTITNDGSTDCTMYGFPGVQLISESGETWDLRRSGDSPERVTLKAGDTTSTARVDMVVSPVPRDLKDTKPFLVDQVAITPPDERESITFDWPYGGAILDQSGATRPGTFVNAIH